MNLEPFHYLPLRGGFLLHEVVVHEHIMQDAAGRVALARTSIVGINLKIELAAQAMDPEQMSISLYHEVLEAAAVASQSPPSAVWEMNEADFETAAQSCHTQFGPVSPDNLNQMLERFGF